MDFRKMQLFVFWAFALISTYGFAQQSLSPEYIAKENIGVYEHLFHLSDQQQKDILEILVTHEREIAQLTEASPDETAAYKKYQTSIRNLEVARDSKIRELLNTEQQVLFDKQKAIVLQ